MSALAARRPSRADLGGPEWASGSVIYKIFVDRFARGGRAREHWAATSDPRETMGGDLAGVRERLDYVRDLGADLLYLTPVFEAPSNHRYDTTDYFRIDPRLGTLRDFQELIRAANERGLRVLIDGVFNHCGETFFAYRDLLERGDRSPYRSWFRTVESPTNRGPRCETWKDAPNMPLLDLDCSAVRDYLYGVAAYWTHQGIDGWRLDAVPHVASTDFWEGFRETVRAINPEAYLLAEIWDDSRPWLRSGHFDGATNYPLRDLLVAFALERSVSASRFAAGLERLLEGISRRNLPFMCNLLGSHDTVRITTLAAGDRDRMRRALLLLFALPGIPSIYYGDEIGLEGGEDPDNRRPMDWAHSTTADLRSFITQLATLRRSLPVLKTGDWKTLVVDDRHDLCVFARRQSEDVVVVGIAHQPPQSPIKVSSISEHLGGARSWKDRLSGETYTVMEDKLSLPAAALERGILLSPLV